MVARVEKSRHAFEKTISAIVLVSFKEKEKNCDTSVGHFTMASKRMYAFIIVTIWRPQVSALRRKNKNKKTHMGVMRPSESDGATMVHVFPAFNIP